MCQLWMPLFIHSKDTKGIPKSKSISGTIFEDLEINMVRSGWLIKLDLDIMPIIILTRFGMATVQKYSNSNECEQHLRIVPTYQRCPINMNLQNGHIKWHLMLSTVKDAHERMLYC